MTSRSVAWQWGVVLLVVSACGDGQGPAKTQPGSGGGGSGGGGGAGTDNDSAVVLPIEVFGVDGVVREVSVNVSAAAAPLAASLSLRLHNVRYATKASVQINDAPWVQLTNETATIAEPGRSLGGIGGAFAVLSLSIPIVAGTVKPGPNTVRFRFDHTNGLSMGFRVLGFDFVDTSGKALLAAGTFKSEDPSKWAAPPGSDAARGKSLWYTATMTESPLAPTKELHAHCTDCHAEDGRDLKYFNYSNLSIIERAKFHGMTAEDGRDIAGYIRGLATPAPGRPWNPPYQPGPGTTAKPAAEWAAGAGVEAALDSEDASLDAMFPGGIDRSALATGNKLHRIAVRDIPITLQLPDWNHWLPEIHPVESLGEAFTSGAANTKFHKLHDRLAAQSPGERAAFLKDTSDSSDGSDGARHAFASWSDESGNLALMAAGIPAGPNGDYSSAGFAWSEDSAKRAYSAKVWTQVRTWQLMQEFQLEEYAPSTYAQGEARAWFSERHLFDTSPFLTGISGGPPCPASEPNCALRWSGSSIGNTATDFHYIGQGWYQLQLTLNAGQRACGGHRCIDWGYAFGFLNDFQNSTQVYEGARRLLWGLKAMDEHDTDQGPKFYDGFSLATANPLKPLNLDDKAAGAWWADAKHPKRKQALAIATEVWLEKLASFTLDDWKKNYDQTEDGANFEGATRVIGSGSNETQERSLGDGLWNAMPSLQASVAPALVNGLGRFGAALWPANDWASRGVAAAGTAPEAPTVSATGSNVELHWTAVPVATSYNILRAESADGPFLTVAYFVSGTSFTDIVPKTAKTYYFAVTANAGESGNDVESAPSTVASVSP